MHRTKEIIWRQFGASIDMLEAAVRACPDRLWYDQSHKPEYWYLVFHTLFWLDAYLSPSPDGFQPPAPFGLEEMDPAGLFPPRPYSKEELLQYLAHGREKCRTTIATLSDGEAQARYILGTLDISRGELLVYTMRHVQHHVAQLHLLLRRETDGAPGWIRATARPLQGT